MIEPAVEFRRGNIPLAVIVLVARREESFIQPMREGNEGAIIFGIVVHRRVFVDHGQIGAMFLTHRETGEEPIIIVTLDHLGLILHRIGDADAIDLLRTVVAQRLH